MSVSEMRRQRKAKAAERLATGIVERAVAQVVAARPSPAPSPQDQATEVKRLRDVEKLAWWLIGQRLGLAQPAQHAADPEAKRGAGKARTLYAAANRGTVPRTHRQRSGTVAKPQGPASKGVPAYVRKNQLVNEGHVIPRDMSDEEVEALVTGRSIEWAIDMARLTETDPETWGPEDKRWVVQDAKVHVSPDCVYVGTDEASGERLLRFREYAGFDTDRQKHMAGPIRVIRVDSIFTVK